jgi:hypothetical protein
LQVDTIDVGGASRNVDLTITEAQAHQLVQDGLHFASNDFVTLEASGVMAIDGIHASGTHLQSTLKDLQKLGVDSATRHTINNLGIDALSLSGITELQDLSDLTSQLKAHGIDNLGLRSSELFDANGDETALFKAFETQDWINNGVKVALEVDNSSATAPDPSLAASTTEPILTDNAAINEFIQHGMDVLNNGGVNLGEGENWGSLIETLSDSGLGRIEIEKTANVHIGDDLSAALYESGMLHALPDANIEIDVAASTKLLSTTLKAMADLGVDKVHASDMVYVKLGVSGEELSSIHDLFSAFGLDSSTSADHKIFENKAGLVLDDKTAQTLGFTSGVDGSVDEAKVTDLVHQLTKLGITEVDVVHTGGTSTNNMDVFHLNTTDVSAPPVAQTPIHTTVEVLGVGNDASHVFDQDILNKNIKH